MHPGYHEFSFVDQTFDENSYNILGVLTNRFLRNALRVEEFTFSRRNSTSSILSQVHHSSFAFSRDPPGPTTFKVSHPIHTLLRFIHVVGTASESVFQLLPGDDNSMAQVLTKNAFFSSRRHLFREEA